MRMRYENNAVFFFNCANFCLVFILLNLIYEYIIIIKNFYCMHMSQRNCKQLNSVSTYRNM